MKRNQYQRFRLEIPALPIVIIVFLVPTLFFSIVLLNNYAQSQMEQSIKSAQSAFGKSAAQVWNRMLRPAY